MKKKIKSNTDIQNEINQIFENYSNLDELTNKINNFIENITGKELVSEFMIYSKIVIRANEHFSKNLSLYRKFKKNLPILFKKNNIPHFIKFVDKLLNQKNIHSKLFMSEIISHCKEFDVYTKKFKYKYNKNSFEMFLEVIRKNKKLSKLYAFLNSNSDIAELLSKSLTEYEDEIFLNLILAKELNNDNLIYFIDLDLDLSQNVDYLYHKLEKKLTKISIQKALQVGLKTKGKFINLHIKLNK